MSENFLVHIDKAKREIAAADSLVKVKDLWNKADAMRALGQAAKDLDLINSATEFKLRCERRLGEMLQGTDLHKGGRPTDKTVNTPSKGFTLKELGIDNNLSSRAQRIAAVPEEKFEAAIATVRQEEQQITHRAIASLIGENFNHRAEGTGDNEWYTPAKYVELARTVLGDIDLDPASSDFAQESIQATKFFTRQDNGLAQPWAGRVWLNPPYTQPDISNFVCKLLAELDGARVASAILLTHNYTDTEWFHRAESKARLICFTKGRIGFVNELGEKAAPTQGQAFFYYGEDKEAFQREFAAVGFIR
jgi:phage N-6-adenine-methyltransferase